MNANSDDMGDQRSAGAEPTPDQIALGLRKWFGRAFAIVLAVALLVVIILGVYRVIQATGESAP